MRIVKRKEFLAMPAGTVFFDYEAHVSGPLSVKTSAGDWTSGDFCRQDIDATEIEASSSTECQEKLDDMIENGTAQPLVFDGSTRDGMFEADQLFAVLDENDVNRLVAVLLGDKK